MVWWSAPGGRDGDLADGIGSLVCGEIREHTDLLEQTRRQAIDRLVAAAADMGADAVVMVRFASSEIGRFRSEILASGALGVLEDPA